MSAWARLPNMGASKTDDHDSPFLSTFAQLARSGLDHDEINRRIGAGALRRVRSGVYAHEPEEAPAKYVNSPEGPLYKKVELLFGLNEARVELRREGEAILCEGNFERPRSRCNPGR